MMDGLAEDDEEFSILQQLSAKRDAHEAKTRKGFAV